VIIDERTIADSNTRKMSIVRNRRKGIRRNEEEERLLARARTISQTRRSTRACRAKYPDVIQQRLN